MFLEVDEFFTQLKSALDYAAKLPRKIIGPSFPWLNTFGDSGGAVIKAIRGNLPEKWKSHGEAIETVILNKHRPWLDIAIEARNRLNHFQDGGLDYRALLVFKRLDGADEHIVVPIWGDDITVRKYIEQTWYHLFMLIEEFSIGFLSMRFKPGLTFLYNLNWIQQMQSPIMVAPENGVRVAYDVLRQIRANDLRRKGEDVAEPTNDQ